MKNNWIEEFDKKWENYEFSVNDYDHYDGADENKIKSYISNLLTKKDQEHKAELEMIKGEIENEIEPPHEHGIDCKHYDDCHNFSNYERWYNKGIKQSISIIDKHINK